MNLIFLKQIKCGGKKTAILILLTLGFLTRFLFFSYPNEVVFDEVHFGKFLSAYLAGNYFFDIHPPLGKLIFAGFAKVIDYKPDFSFGKIGDKFPDENYKWLRSPSKLFGAFLPVIVFLAAYELGISRMAAFFAGLFAVFENGLLVQSRFILLDIFLLDFGFLSIFFYLRWLKNQKQANLFSAVLFAVFAGSVKWTGFSFLVIIALHYLTENALKIKKLLFASFYFVVFPLFLYASFFLAHFYLLPNSGTGNDYHTPAFQKTLLNSKYYSNNSFAALSFPGKIIELNKIMAGSNLALETPHPDQSKWFFWPFMKKAVGYWGDSDDSLAYSRHLYFVGNPFIWLAGSAGVIFAMFKFFKLLFLRLKKIIIKDNFFRPEFSILFLGYILNFLPFFIIKRSMFLYHYLPALIFSIFILFYILDRYAENGFLKKSVYFKLSVLAILFFIIFSPLTYGFLFPSALHNFLIKFPFF